MTAPVNEKLPTPLRRLGARSAEEWISLVRVMILLMLILALSLGIIPINHPTIHTTVALVGVYVLLLALGPRWFALLRKADLTKKQVTTIAGTGQQRRSALWPGIMVEEGRLPKLPERFVGKLDSDDNGLIHESISPSGASSARSVT